MARGGGGGRGVGVVGRGLIATDRALPPQRRVLTLQRLQLKREGCGSGGVGGGGEGEESSG